MKTVWKWTLSQQTTIQMPVGAEILCVQTQYEEPQLWALVDPIAVKEERKFSIYGTGHTINGDPGKYVGTFQILRGTCVFHVFEDKQ